VSDTSNSVQVTTLVHVAPIKFKKPLISQLYWGLASVAVGITFRDSSDCEIGYRLLRSEKFSPVFTVVRDLPSANPDSMGYRTWYDSSISFNKWYNYKIEVYKSDSSLFSAPCSTFTLKALPPERIVTFTQLSTFPLSVSGWSAKAGDSIILKETSAPAGTPFSVINVSNPSSPNFAGYIDSATALSYPMQTLIPAYMRFNISYQCGYPFQQVMWNNNRIIVGERAARSISIYQVQQDTLAFLDSIVMPTKSVGAGNGVGYVRDVLPLNDSLLAVRFDVSYSDWPLLMSHDYLYPIYLLSSGFSPLSEYRIDTNYYYDAGISLLSGSKTSSRSWIHGYWNNNILVSLDVTHEAYTLKPPIYITRDTVYTYWRKFYTHDISSNRSFLWDRSNSGTNLPFGNGRNTGRYISATEALSTNRSSSSSTDLFVADVRDYDAYAHAVSNNAVLTLNSPYSQMSLQNIFLDTLNRHVYLIYTNYLVILGYSFGTPAATINKGEKSGALKQLRIIPDAARSGVTIVRSDNSHAADFYFYDLSGRVVDKILGVTSNAVLWRPKTRSMNCYIVMVKSGAEKYTKRFMMR